MNEGVELVAVDMAWKLNKQVKVFSLDTGRLHPETYRFIDQVREQYNLPIEILSPDRDKLDPFVKEKGLFSFQAMSTSTTSSAPLNEIHRSSPKCSKASLRMSWGDLLA